ncbi:MULTISPECIES: metallophosphoesterase [Bradyrhizobium]|uniref:metallophosphoesterase n=1 Tax=Bradyrhizobium TaxID=374 RepID=UPI0003FC9CE1|nr:MULTISPECIES: metallophosphoesterase [Bradyrhizobium]UFW48184.1 metallophosphoesterase [Bradyrhizobium arachidis]
MRLWTVSDLHLEMTRGWDLPAPADRPAFDVMIVAGDLIPRMERGVAWLRERVQDRPVLYIPGNHEFYGCDIDRTVEKAHAAAAGTNIHVLQNDAVTIDGITFLGATLWTDFDLFDDPAYAMSVAGDVMNDYRKIRHGNYEFRLRPEHTLSRHLQSRDFIARELRKDGRHVVVTHMGPVPEATRRGCERDISSAAYTSDLRGVIREGAPELWAFGHTHESRDFEVRSTRMVSNAKGYGPWPGQQATWDNPNFDPNFVIEI